MAKEYRSTTNYLGETLVSGLAKPGDRVAYSDTANLWTEWEVIEKTGPADYLLVDDEGHTNSSDLRQYGWVFVG